MTPEGGIQAAGHLMREMRRDRHRSPWVLAGAVLLFLMFAFPAGFGVYCALRDAGGKPSTDLVLPGIALLSALLLARRWFLRK